MRREKYFGIVYKATNKINGKIYIGQTKGSLRERKNNHVCDALNKKTNSHFHNAIRKYGKKNFDWEILKYCNSREELDITETSLIKEYACCVSGYNIATGGGTTGLFGVKNSFYGKVHTIKSREKISKSRKGKCTGRDHPIYGKHRSKKIRDKISETKSLYWLVIFPDGKKVVIKNLNKFCNRNNLHVAAMYRVANGQQTQHKKFKCKKIYDLLIIQK